MGENRKGYPDLGNPDHKRKTCVVHTHKWIFFIMKRTKKNLQSTTPQKLANKVIPKRDTRGFFLEGERVKFS